MKMSNTTAKLLFHMLLTGAMEFREEYFQEEIRIQRELLFTGATDEKLATSREAQRKLLRKAETKATQIKQRILDFNKLASKELQDLGSLSAEEKAGFDSITKYMKLVAEEVSACKNIPQLLLLVRMYNEGAFKDALQGLEDAIQPVAAQDTETTTAADGGDLGATGIQNSPDVSEDAERDEKPIQE